MALAWATAAKDALSAGEAYGLYLCDYLRGIGHHWRDGCRAAVFIFFVPRLLDSAASGR